LSNTRTRKAIIATSYSLVGVAILIAAIYFGVFPQPLWLWALFAVAFTVLELNSVEVNDRLLQSSSVMPALTAGVVFVLSGYSATLGLAAMAALGPLVPADIRQKRLFQPLTNFGQLVASAGAAGLVLDVMLADLALPVTGSDVILVVAASLLAALVYSLVNWQLVRIAVRTVYGPRQLVPWSHMTGTIGRLLLMGVVGGLLGALVVQEPAALPLIFFVYAIGHMSVVSYARLREAEEATLRGFVKALEAKDLYTRGHTERVAYFSRIIGEQLAFSGTQLQNLRWAALIHDVGKLAVPGDLIRKKGKLDPDEYAEVMAHAHLVEEILAEVDFLQRPVEIASGHHSHYDGNGYGGSGHQPGKQPSLESCIVAVADAFDAMTSTRSYRMALTQAYAIDELRRNSGSQFHPVVVDALEKALVQTGEIYGSAHLSDEAVARHLAEGDVFDVTF
jgi:HD-GYP domain-containing protein (c-di-GMP phosphodiesterase class II)